MSLLEVKNLHTYFTTKKGIVKAVNDVTYSLDAGKTLGIVGESGSGKSVSAMSIIKLLDGNGYIESGSIVFDGKDIMKASDKDMYHIRGNEISVIFQEPMTSLNPVFTVQRQIGEVLRIHQHMNKKQAYQKAVSLLSDVKIPNPERVGPAVSVPALRRHAAARHDCHGAGLPPEAPDCRRAHHRSGRDHPGADFEADERSEARIGRFHPVHHA